MEVVGIVVATDVWEIEIISRQSLKMRRNNNKTMRRGPVKGRRRGDNQMISHPPQLPSYGITRDVRMRFAANAAFAGAITFQNLLDTVLVETGATTGVDLYQAVRLNSVEVWGIAALGTPATALVIFDGAVVGASGDQKTHTDTSMGVEPAHVKARPDPLTQAGQFQPSANNTAFFLECPSGSVVDVSLTFRQPVNGAAVAAQNNLVGGTAGVIAYRGLDGKAAASTSLPVQGVLSSA